MSVLEQIEIAKMLNGLVMMEGDRISISCNDFIMQ
jgi:hypothetical protein